MESWIVSKMVTVQRQSVTADGEQREKHGLHTEENFIKYLQY